MKQRLALHVALILTTNTSQSFTVQVRHSPVRSAADVTASAATNVNGNVGGVSKRRMMLHSSSSSNDRGGNNNSRLIGYHDGMDEYGDVLTREEEVQLLERIVEYKRIREVQANLPQSARMSYPQVSLVKRTGYESLADLQQAMDGGLEAREKLVMSHMRLVRSIVNTVARSRKLNSLTREDLVNEGVIGLNRAIEKYDSSRKNGGRFSTYATYWIRAALLRVIAEKDDFVRAPEHVTYAINKIRDASRSLGVDMDDFLSNKAWKEANEARKLAEMSGLTNEQFEYAAMVADRRIGGGFVEMKTYYEPGFYGATKVDNGMGDDVRDESSIDMNSFREVFSPFLKPKELEILQLRFGIEEDFSTTQPKSYRDYEAEAEKDLFGETVASTNAVRKGKNGEAMSFQEVGKRVGVSAEYCRRLCGQALKKLRQAAADGHLDPAFFGAY